MAKKKATSRRATPAKSKPVVSEANYWVLVWMPSGTPIPPYDSNPGSSDEGLMVYRNECAAKSAAEHQQNMYGCDDDSETATPIPLERFSEKQSGGFKRKSR